MNLSAFVIGNEYALKFPKLQEHWAGAVCKLSKDHEWP